MKKIVSIAGLISLLFLCIHATAYAQEANSGDDTGSDLTLTQQNYLVPKQTERMFETSVSTTIPGVTPSAENDVPAPREHSNPPVAPQNQDADEEGIHGFVALFGIGYEGYLINERHTFDFNASLGYSWKYVGLFLSLDLGLSGETKHDSEPNGSSSNIPFVDGRTYSSNAHVSFLGNLNVLGLLPHDGFLFSLGVGPGFAYIGDPYFSVRISLGMDKIFKGDKKGDANILFGASINYIPMFDFNGEYEHAIGFVIHVGQG